MDHSKVRPQALPGRHATFYSAVLLVVASLLLSLFLLIQAAGEDPGFMTWFIFVSLISPLAVMGLAGGLARLFRPTDGKPDEED